MAEGSTGVISKTFGAVKGLGKAGFFVGGVAAVLSGVALFSGGGVAALAGGASLPNLAMMPVEGLVEGTQILAGGVQSVAGFIGGAAPVATTTASALPGLAPGV